MIRALALHRDDNVATLIDDGRKGDECHVHGKQTVSLRLAEGIAYGHKVALRDLGSGDPVTKYGQVIGLATKSIRMGEHIHVHNIEAQRGRGDKVGKGKSK